MHGVSAASSSLLEVLYYFQQVYSGYTLGFIYQSLSQTLTMTFSCWGDLRFPNSAALFCRNFCTQIPIAN